MSALIRYFIIAIVLVSVWRVSNGDLTWIIDTVIGIFNTAVDALTTLLSNTFGSPSSPPAEIPEIQVTTP